MSRTPRFSRPARDGFTLIEVMIVLAILAALFGLVAINVVGSKKDAKVGEARIALGTIERALDMFYADFDRYPTEEEGVKVLWDKESLVTEDEADQEKWRKRLQKPSPNDPWGTAWGYRAESEHGAEYDLWSNGADKEEGTDDDIVSWVEDEEGGSSSSTDSSSSSGG